MTMRKELRLNVAPLPIAAGDTMRPSGRLCNEQDPVSWPTRQPEPCAPTSKSRRGFTMNGVKNSTPCLTLLSQVLLQSLGSADRELNDAAALPGTEQLTEIRSLAHSHHVILRAFPMLQRMAAEQNDSFLVDWVAIELEREQERIHRALSCLQPICEALAAAGKVVVIKSLDHWPDLGSDLDLFTNAQASEVVTRMKRHFDVKLAQRSWGDRLANKWNFMVPELPEL